MTCSCSTSASASSLVWPDEEGGWRAFFSGDFSKEDECCFPEALAKVNGVSFLLGFGVTDFAGEDSLPVPWVSRFWSGWLLRPDRFKFDSFDLDRSAGLWLFRVPGSFFSVLWL